MPQTHLNEASRIADFLTTLLDGDAMLIAAAPGGAWTNRVWQDYAPLATVQPFVIVSRAGGTDLVALGASRVYAVDLWTVKAVGQVAVNGTRAAMETIEDRIDALLHGQAGTTSDGRLLGIERMDLVSYSEVTSDGAIWKHEGGVYRIYAQPLTGA